MNDNRRQLLISAGITLPLIPKTWSIPVINSVVLPAHAQTSDPVCLPVILPAMTISVLNSVTGDSLNCSSIVIVAFPDGTIQDFSQILPDGVVCPNQISVFAPGPFFSNGIPGSYQIDVSSVGFNQKSITVEVSADECGPITETVNINLTPI